MIDELKVKMYIETNIQNTNNGKENDDDDDETKKRHSSHEK